MSEYSNFVFLGGFVVGWVVLFLISLPIIFGICMALSDENEKKNYENKIKLNQERWKKGSDVLIQSGMADAIHYALKREVGERIDRQVEWHIINVGYRPENASQFFEDKTFFAKATYLDTGFSGSISISYNKLGYSSISEEQRMSLMYALSLKKEWELIDLKNSYALKPNKQYWMSYIQNTIDFVCKKKGVQPLKKV